MARASSYKERIILVYFFTLVGHHIDELSYQRPENGSKEEELTS